MRIEELEFEYPSELVATEPRRPSRVLYVPQCLRADPASHANPALPSASNMPSNSAAHEEISISELLSRFRSGDVLVVNDTRVIPRRVFVEDLEILFVEEVQNRVWQALLPAKGLKLGDRIELPDGIKAQLIEKGMPQLLELSKSIDDSYFEKYGEPPLPPYIQKLRTHRHSSPEDKSWYQTAWAQVSGSSAAPTASLHFSNEDLKSLEERGVHVAKLTLHVGLGTYLPVQSVDLKGHTMHRERVSIPKVTLDTIERAKKNGGRVWALGTTCTRALEAQTLGHLKMREDTWEGDTDLLILPGFRFQVVDCLLTNFHQPKSTLLALVFAFAGRQRVLDAYKFAIEKSFRLFSYGDLSVWERPGTQAHNCETQQV